MAAKPVGSYCLSPAVTTSGVHACMSSPADFSDPLCGICAEGWILVINNSWDLMAEMNCVGFRIAVCTSPSPLAYSGRLDKASGLPPAVPGLYLMTKSNCESASAHRACLWFRVLVDVKYRRF